MKDDVMHYVTDAGDLVIPFNSDKKYHYWNGGQHLADTLAALKVTDDVWRKYTGKPYPGE